MVEPDECGSHTVESYTQCSSPSASVQGPFSRKRPPSPELTTCSLSTFGQPCGKKICFSSFSDSRQPQSVLTAARLHSRDRNTVQPEHTALTSAVTVDDDDDLDEAVSSFRAPPGHLPHNDCFAHALPQALPATFGKQPHHTIFDSVHTATSYTPAAGLLSCKSEPFTAQQQSALPTHASSLMCLPRQYSLPITLSFPGLSINTLQVSLPDYTLQLPKIAYHRKIVHETLRI